ncbi:MAG TPA: hypothetical protein VIY86_07480, partial [Pirellulaceae bacterium]
YRAYVQGTLVATGGDLEKKITAFDEKKSVEITKQVKGHSQVTLAVQVHDWYGAGGIFRPISLSTEPLHEHNWVLK